MTKNETRELHTEHMTPDYFYPDVLNEDLGKLKIPTIDELEFIGVANAKNIRHYFRGEEEKLRKNHAEILHTISSISEEATKIATDQHKAKCDWQGITTELQSSLSCRFGKEVAEWCTMNPKKPKCIPCIKGDPINGTPQKCQHYDLCHHSLFHYGKPSPLQEKPCIFCYDNDGGILRHCQGFLQAKADDYANRRRFVMKYIHNLTVALKNRENKKPPFFDLATQQYLSQIENGSGILEFVRKDDGSIDIRHGIFIAKIRDYREEVFVLNMYDGEMIKIPTVRFSHHAEREFITIEDFNYLLSNANYRQVWLRFHPIIGRQFSSNELRNIFIRFNLITELINQMKN